MQATTNKPALAEIWDDNRYGLEGINTDYRQGIDRDQAVDDDGNALYESYAMMRWDNEDNCVIYEYSVEEMEAFARTW